MSLVASRADTSVTSLLPLDMSHFLFAPGGWGILQTLLSFSGHHPLCQLLAFVPMKPNGLVKSWKRHFLRTQGWRHKTVLLIGCLLPFPAPNPRSAFPREGVGGESVYEGCQPIYR